jgi:hypothetical protein
LEVELAERLLSQRNFGNVFGQRFQQQVMTRMFPKIFPECSPEASKPPAYIASKCGGNSTSQGVVSNPKHYQIWS